MYEKARSDAGFFLDHPWLPEITGRGMHYHAWRSAIRANWRSSMDG